MMMGNLSAESKGKMFRTAINMPAYSFIDLVVPESVKRDIRISELKDGVHKFIMERKRASVTEISEKFDIDFNEAFLVLKKLEAEKKIKIK